MTHSDGIGLGPAGWGSDVIAGFLRRTGVEFIALNPGASFRGLHDSMVNYLGDRGPTMLMTLHEEHAVAIAHGYAKMSGRAMAVALHSNVGLMHATMAIYNAYADRVPMLILGAAGPLDADARRPWIDWLHTTADQPAIVRNYTKWDDTPASLAATMSSLARAWEQTQSPPSAPTYVVLDVTVQEEPVENATEYEGEWTPTRLIPAADEAAVAKAVELLRGARSPVILSGRSSLHEGDYARRIQLAEAVGARVITDLKANSSFPTEHPLHVSGAGFFLSDPGRRALADADVVLALDWIDPAGTLSQAPSRSRSVIVASVDQYLHNGWSKDHFDWMPTDVWLTAAGDHAVSQILSRLPDVPPSARPAVAGADSEPLVPGRQSEPTIELLAQELRAALQGHDATLVRLPLGWDSAYWPFSSPADYLGYDGGGGIGSGPGMVVGAALAARESDRIIVGVLGDGDFLMGATALWTAVKYGAPCLIVISNNRSYFNDEVHQERVANDRGRDVGRKWIGQRIDDPLPDLAGIARAQGAEAYGPIRDSAELPGILRRAIDEVRRGKTVLVDVHVAAGYAAQMAKGLVEEAR